MGRTQHRTILRPVGDEMADCAGAERDFFVQCEGLADGAEHDHCFSRFQL
jgi:hypothetical protein